MANTTENDWDESSPAITHARRAGAAEILSLRQGVRLRMEREHEDFDPAGLGGEHLQGSAKVYRQASAPTMRPDGVTSLDSDDAGRVWVDSDDGVIKVWDGDSWESVLTPDNPPNNTSFHKDIASATVPQDQTGLTNGHVYLVFVYGTTTEASSGDAYSISITVNSVTRTITVNNHPDGTAPFMIPFVVTVTSSRIRISAASNITLLMGMTGIRLS